LYKQKLGFERKIRHMNNPLNDTTTVTIFVRHSEECIKENGLLDRNYRKCNCRKWLYIYENGKGRRISAGTRTWAEAERKALAERIRLDPVEVEKRRLRAEDDEQRGKAITVIDALKEWVGEFKGQSPSTAGGYRSDSKKIREWAERNEITLLQDITRSHLSVWRSHWSKVADPKADPATLHKGDRMSLASQQQFQIRVKAFFKWAVENGHLAKDPAAALKPIRYKLTETQPLSKAQFDQLIAQTDLYDGRYTRACDKWGAELKAIFLAQRWAGLRIIDVLMLPRKALVGKVLSLKTLKTGAQVRTSLPSHVVKALKALKPRSQVHPLAFFWNRTSGYKTLEAAFLKRIRGLNRYLNFHDEEGQPMRFHSHMLRDTFAVELLLAGFPLEKVSKLLTHTSVRVTEKHYAPWVKQRLQQLDEDHVAIMKKMGAKF
jgi:site-specific recombinase XerD